MLKSFTCQDLFRPAFVLEYLELFTLTVYFLGGGRASGIHCIFNDISWISYLGFVRVNGMVNREFL